MSTNYRILTQCYNVVRTVTDFEPEIGLVLGSGLGGVVDSVVAEATIPYGMLPAFPVSTVSGHDGAFVLGTLGGKRVVCMRGRVHYYEGYSSEQVVMPIRLMKMLGASKLILTNVSGGINRNFREGDVIALSGHIATFVPSPLRGENVEELGTRFPDMSEVYSPRIRALMRKVVEGMGLTYKEGVYLQAPGPQYETPEEVRMFGLLGADLVGMSTAIEAIAARHAGLEVGAFSCVANMAAGIAEERLSHEKVKELADRRAPVLSEIMEKLVAEI